jgi:hypothetical protein
MNNVQFQRNDILVENIKTIILATEELHFNF